LSDRKRRFELLVLPHLGAAYNLGELNDLARLLAGRSAAP
jgi:hypothetical protein